METKRQEDIRKLMQMPEEAIASLNESEADRLGRLAVMFYKETGDGCFVGKQVIILEYKGRFLSNTRNCALRCLMQFNCLLVKCHSSAICLL